MSNDEIKKIAELVKTIVKEEVKPINEKLGLMSTRLEENTKKLEENSEELKSVGDQVAVLTVKVDGEIIPTLENHSRLLKKIALSTEKNVENIFRLDKRVSVVEANAGIQPPSELHIIR